MIKNVWQWRESVIGELSVREGKQGERGEETI